MRTRAVLLSVLLSACFGSACSHGIGPPGPEPSPAPVRLLVFTATAGYRHTDAIAAARAVLPPLGAEGAFTVTTSEEVADLGAARLASFDVVMFAMTSGELPLTDDEKSALIGFVTHGVRATSPSAISHPRGRTRASRGWCAPRSPGRRGGRRPDSTYLSRASGPFRQVC